MLVFEFAKSRLCIHILDDVFRLQRVLPIVVDLKRLGQNSVQDKQTRDHQEPAEKVVWTPLGVRVMISHYPLEGLPATVFSKVRNPLNLKNLLVLFFDCWNHLVEVEFLSIVEIVSPDISKSHFNIGLLGPI